MKESQHRLTDEQRELVSENHNLIYSFAKKKGLDLSDFYDILAIGLCQAGRTYALDRGCSFSTYAYFCMENEYKQYIRQSSAVKRISDFQIISYEDLLEPNEVNSSEILDVLEDTNPKRDISEVYVKDFLNALNDRERFVLSAVMSGYAQKDIAKVLRVSQAQVSRIKTKIKRLWDSYNQIKN